MGIRRDISISLLIFAGAASGHFACDSDKVREPDGSLLHKFLYDTVALQYELLSTDTLKVLACFAPLYGAGRLADDTIHTCFYCPKHHKNCCSIDRRICKAFEVTSLTLAAGLSLLVLNPWDEDLAQEGRVFASGLAPLYVTKNLIKYVHHDGSVRPRCEYFSRSTQYHGGFPSGHMAFMTYAAMFWGLERGWLWGVPLGVASATMFGVALNSNRHFASQLIAGAALGVAYGIAGHKVINCYKQNAFACDLTVGGDGAVGLQLAYSF